MASLFVLVNGHFGVLQAVAWGKMLWSYTHENGSLLVAAKQTFDGDHPCHMCDSIKEAKGKEQHNQSLLAAIKIELFADQNNETLPLPDSISFSYPHAADLFACSLGHAPPRPVPIPVG